VAHPDVLIVGGGVIGAATAFYLSAQGVKVTLLERRHDGGHASNASAAVLHPIEEPDAPDHIRKLSEASFAMFPELVDEIREITGIDSSLQQCGWLRVALLEAAADDLRARFRAAAPHGHVAEWLSPEDVWELEPSLSPAILAGIRLPAGAQLYAPAFLRGLLQGAAMRGAHIRTGVEVAALVTDGNAVTGVQLADGESIFAGHTVVAGGAWSAALLGRIGITVPVQPLRGQILSLHATPTPLKHVVFGADVYLAPKADGSTVVGATVEQAGFDDRLTGDGVNFLLLHGIRLAPILGSATFRRAWVGLRPASPDGLPILGPAGDWKQLSLATGHTMEGILLSPITGRLIAQLATGKAPDLPIEPFGLQRFA
jgi:glycine oxidase